MRITRSNNERLVITHFPLVMAAIGVVPALVALAVVIATATNQTPPTKGQQPWFGAAVFVGIALVWGGGVSFFAKRVTYDFDLVRRQLHWRRRSIYGTKEGLMPFDDIKCAWVEAIRSSDDDVGGTWMYCPALSTTHGKFPLLNFSTGGSYAGQQFQRLADAINAALKASGATILEDEIRRLVSQGEGPAAVELARKRYGYDLLQAQQFIDSLAKRLSPERDRPM